MKRDLELLYEVGCLRNIKRVWVQFGLPGVANIAEHHFRVMYTAMMIAKREEADLDKVLKMALVHDLGESRTGDAHYLSGQYVERNEELAVEDMFDGTSLKDDLVELWKEYEARESLEAKCVKDADWLDVDLELRELAAQGQTISEVFKGHREVVKDKLYTNTGKKYWEAIQGSNPHDWHMNGRNRFSQGDMKS